MNYKRISRILAQILMLEAFFMLPAMGISIHDGKTAATLGFIYTIGIIAAVSGIFFLLSRKMRHGFYAREGMVCVGLGWILMSLFGCLPFVFSGEIPAFIDALFEIVSGFTTTGASILSDVEAMSRGLLYWRSFSHWVGGMGVLVLLLFFVSAKNERSGSALHILRAESPGPSVGKLLPRMKQTAFFLYLIYIVLTILNFIFLVAGKMPVFDSICTAFGTAGTGGFGVRNDSIAGYSPYLQWVCTVFMLLFGVNFSCYFMVLTRQFRAALGDEELRTYFIMVLVSVFLIVINLRNFYASMGENIRHASFQVASIITTTGFSTTDFDLWPNFSKAILVFLMIIGACAGSTGGGLKCIRMILLLKSMHRNLKKSIYPNKVEVVRINRQPINERVISSTTSYLIAYVVIVVVSFLVISLDGFPLATNLTAVLATFNNIGPGLEAVGPACNFSGFSELSKLVFIFDMLAGRLEILPMMLLFTPSTWRRR